MLHGSPQSSLRLRSHRICFVEDYNFEGRPSIAATGADGDLCKLLYFLSYYTDATLIPTQISDYTIMETV